MVGEFGADAAIAQKGADGDKRDNGEVKLGAHGIRVGDVVRVNEIGSGPAGGKKAGGGKDKAVGKEKGGPEGVVTRVGERRSWVALGQVGGGGRSKEDDEAIEELWGKKLWLYVFSPFSWALCLVFDPAWFGWLGQWFSWVSRIDAYCVRTCWTEVANGSQHKTCKRCDASTVSGFHLCPEMCSIG